jgi:hypothetical protein
VVAIGVPELASAARRQDNLKHASLIPGPSGNIVFSNQQTNFVLPGTNLADEIGKFGDPHPDFDDDEPSMTFMWNLSHLEKKLHGGRFLIPGLKAAIPLKPRSVIGFSARFLHFALPILRVLCRGKLPTKPTSLAAPCSSPTNRRRSYLQLL